jgi:hypothetical protein
MLTFVAVTRAGNGLVATTAARAGSPAGSVGGANRSATPTRKNAAAAP